MEETNNAELVARTSLSMVSESSSDNKDDAIKSDNIFINSFLAASKVISTVKRASRIGLPVQGKNRPIKVVMNAEDERNRILSNLRNLKGIPEYKTISVTEDYTITERQMIKDLSDTAKGKNKNE